MPSVVEQAEADEAAKKKPTTGKRIIPGVALAMIAATIALEGGYVNHSPIPAAKRTWALRRTAGKTATSDLCGRFRAKSPKASITKIYRRAGITNRLIAIDAPVTEELYDTASTWERFASVAFFQQSINELCGTRLAVDGHVGPGHDRGVRVMSGAARGGSPMCGHAEQPRQQATGRI
jgi:lysozyme family protein